MLRIELLGHVPSKKNLWKPRRGGGIVLQDEQARAEIDALIIQASALGQKNYLESPDMRVTFYVRDRRGDRDNKLSTLLDVLQHGGILFDDNIKWFNGTVTLMPAIVDKNERTVIEIL